MKRALLNVCRLLKPIYPFRGIFLFHLPLLIVTTVISLFAIVRLLTCHAEERGICAKAVQAIYKQ
jgi:hypothetical protein